MNEALYKEILNRSPIGYAYHKVIVDDNGDPDDLIFLDINDTLCGFLGMKKDEVIGQKATKILPGIKERSPNWVEVYGRIALEGREEEFEGFSEVFNAPYRVRVFSPQKGYFVLIVSDVRKEKGLEEEIVEFFEISPYEIYRFDKNGRILSVNSKAGRNSGYGNQELIGKNIMDFVVADERIDQFVDRVFSGGKKTEYDLAYPYRTKLGENRYGRCTVIKRSDEDYVAFTNDITDYYTSKLEEERIKQQYNKLFRNLSCAAIIYEVSGDGSKPEDYILMDVNKAFEATEKVKKQDVIGKSLDAFKPNVKDFGIVDIFAKVLKTGKAVHYPSTLYKDNKYNNYYENDVIKLSDNKIVALYNDVTDIMMNARLLKSYFDKAPYGVVIVDKKGNFIDANAEVEKMSGYTKQELKKMNVTDMIVKEAKGVGNFARLIEKGNIDAEQKCRTKNGDIRIWSGRATKINENSFLGFVEDITEKKEAARKLEESREETKALIDCSGVAIGYFDSEGRVIWLNKLAARILGGSPEHFAGKTLQELHDKKDADKYMKRLNKAIRQKKVQEYEDKMRLKSGEYWFRTTFNSIYNAANELLGIEIISKDITDLKKSEEALKKSEERFRSMVESSNTIMLLIDADTARIEHANLAACKFYGWPMEVMLRKTQYDINVLPKKEVDQFIKCVVEKGSCQVSLKHKIDSGEVRDVVVSTTLIEIGGKKQLFSIIHDDTERIRTEELLKESESRFRLLFEDAPLGYQSLDENGDLIVVNDKWLEMLGYKEEEVIGKNFSEFIVSGQKRQYEKSFARYKEQGVNVVTFDMIKKDRGTITVSFNGRVAYNDDGSFKQTHCILKDITKQQEFQKKIVQNERRLQRSQKVAKSGTWEIEGDSNMIWASDNAFEIFGFPPNTGYISIEDIEKVIHEEDRKMAHESLVNFRNGKKAFDTIYRIKLKTTEEIKYIHSVAELETDNDSKQKRVLGAIRDITEQVLLEKEKAKTDVILRNQQKLESIGTLASGIAHEINNPINGILNYGQVIADSVSEDSEINGFAQGIIQETNRVSTIVKNLLHFSRQSKQSHSYARIEDIIEKTLSLIRTIFRHDNIELNVDIAENICQVKCRSQQIQQVLMNLLTNARDSLNNKYPSYDNNKIINLRCNQFSKDERKWISITVEDFGTGIPKSIKDRIFDPFFTTKDKDTGTGLGLSISYGIVQEHHGEIKIKSKEGEYTRFIVSLPCDNGWDINNNKY